MDTTLFEQNLTLTTPQVRGQIEIEMKEPIAANFEIGQTVYHRMVYNHCEPLKIVGISKTELLLEGDYSGGTHNVCQRSWLPIKGTSRIYNHLKKLEFRKQASDIEVLAYPCSGSKDPCYLAMMDMVHAVKVLTNDVTYNPEF